MNVDIRFVSVNGRDGIAAAKGSGSREGQTFVLFDDDDVNESAAGWFYNGDVWVTSILTTLDRVDRVGVANR